VRSSTASKTSSTPFLPGRRGRQEQRVPKGRREIPADRRDLKARRVPMATTGLPDPLAWMGLKDRKARREMRGLPVPLARLVPRVRLDLKAHPEPMDSQEDLLGRPAVTALKDRLERMARKVRRGR